MSASTLLDYLKKLDAELIKGAKAPDPTAKTKTGRKGKAAIEAYRTARGNKKYSTLTYAPQPLREALTYLQPNLSPEILKDYDDLIVELSKEMKKAFEGLRDKIPSDVELVGPMGDGTLSIAIIKSGQRDNYTTLKNSYTAKINVFYQKILVLLKMPEGIERTDKPGRVVRQDKFLGQTHEGGDSNVKHQIHDAVHDALDQMMAKSGVPETAIVKYLEEIDSEDARIILSIIKSGKLGQVNLGISSALLNSQTGAGIEEQGLKDQLNKAITNLSTFLAIPFLGGSDSLAEAHRKKLIKELVKPFTNIKGISVKVKHEDFKIEESTGTTELIIAAGKYVAGKSGAGKAPSKKRLRKTGKRKVKAPRMALKNILGLINAKLPQQVADNMGAPRLENQTGRFAQSVRAVTATETAQGFKSIGYMYQKNPYQVFESTSGTRFSDAARDPRPLIDTSIREIVAQFGLGRLYTRRL